MKRSVVFSNPVILVAFASLVVGSTAFESIAEADQAAPPETEKKEAKKKVEADYVKVLASHSEANPGDPVSVVFTKFAVRNVRFNPRKIVGSKAELVIDVSSLSSGKTKRDVHLRSKDFIDVEKRNQAVVSIVVKKRLKRAKAFSATATVTLGKIKKKWPVTLEVLSADAKTGTRFKVTHEFKRSDFGVGSTGGPVAEKLTAEAVLTFK